MSVRFDCPSCKANYEVDDGLAGKMIMCRVCKKRGAVRSLAAAKSSATTTAAAGGMFGTATLSAANVSVAADPSRRSFLVYAGGLAASLTAIAAGALLARQPWRRWIPRPTDPNRRFGPQLQDGKQDGKGAAQDGKGGGV
ncbi:MAG: zinc ribbon domain-containing protein [Gemmataceae bacterium]